MTIAPPAPPLYPRIAWKKWNRWSAEHICTFVGSSRTICGKPIPYVTADGFTWGAEHNGIRHVCGLCQNIKQRRLT